MTVVGSINADLMVSVDRHPMPGETLMGSGGEILAGGKGANQAVAAALRGAQVSFVGAVGDDPYAEPALEHLRSSGVNLDHVERLEATSTGLAVITVAADGENTIIVIPGANHAVDSGFVQQHAEVIAGADVVLLQGEIPSDGFGEAVALASNSGSRVVVNLAPVVEVDPDLLRRANPLIVNEHEAGLVARQLGIVEMPTSPDEVVATLLKLGFASVVLTLGARGAVVTEAGTPGIAHIPTPNITAVDTTGAGDAFTGALVAKLLEGSSLPSAAQHAARVGAFAALSPGAQPSYPKSTDKLPEV
ncbi:ribokinase [Corynebacterium phocae]|nr:ribokinase [Corynebacterium phocae]